MIIDRADIEAIVRTMIDERLQDLADSMKSAAYNERDHGGRLEGAIAGAFDAIRDAINSNIEEANR